MSIDEMKTCLVTGASGLLGYHVVSQLTELGFRVYALVHSHNLVANESVESIKFDLTQLDHIDELVSNLKPDAILHCAGLTDVNLCEEEPDLAQCLHVNASAALAGAARKNGSRFVHISTDHLWDGSKSWVDEGEQVCPLNVYGETKAAGEQAVLEQYPEALVVRTNFFGRGLSWRASFSDWLEQKFKEEGTFTAFNDVYFTPIEVSILCDVLIKLLNMDVNGILHVAGSERLSKYDFAIRFARHFGFDEGKIVPGSVKEQPMQAARPLDMSLDTRRASELFSQPLANINASFDRLAAGC